MKSPIPVTIITGYLGAGKTTLVNALLTQERNRRIAVLVNDFGEIAIDQNLIISQDSDMIALANGCMCCSLGDDLFRALDRVLGMNPRPDHLVIETSGVADPKKVRQIAIAESELAYRATVTLVDAVNFDSTLSDPMLSDTLVKQLREGQLIVLTKADLVTPVALEKTIARSRNSTLDHARFVVSDGYLPSDLILGDLDVQHEADDGDALGRQHDHPYRSWLVYPKGPIEEAALEAFLQRGDLGVYRLKGFVLLTDGRPVIVQKVGRNWSIETDIAEHAVKAACLVAIGAAHELNTVVIDAAWSAVDQISANAETAV